MVDNPKQRAPVVKKMERRLGLGSVVAISLSAMLGSGIFVLPGLAAAKTGPSVWLAYVVAGLCILPAALSKSELATAMPTSGGTYVYLDQAFGPLAGTIAGLGLWVSFLLKSSFALIGFGAYLVVFADLPVIPTALALLGVIVLLNIRGIRKVSRAQVIVVSVSIAGLVALSGAGFFSFEPSRLEHAFPLGSGGFLAAVGFLFVSYAGVTKVAAIAEEIRHPERNLPSGMLLSLLIATLLYGAVALALVGAIPMADLQQDLHPIFTLAHIAGGWVVGMVAAVLGVLTMTSMANAGLLAASRFTFAMSRNKLLPSRLGMLHAQHLTPTASIFMSGAFMAAAILLLDIGRIAKLASTFEIMIFISMNVTVIVLRESRAQWYKPPFRSPLYPWVQAFGIFSGLVLLLVMGFFAMAAALAVAIPGAVVFLAYGRRRTKRRGVVGIRGRRRELLRPTQSLEPLAEAELTGEAAAVVSLFGRERSPETLVELGAALCEQGAVEVVHLTEVPEQTILAAVDEGDLVRASVRRRILAMAESRDIPLEFEAIASRDIIRSVHEITSRLHCRWLVMEWGGRARGTFTIQNPLGWLRDHLSCNLAIFHDAGVRYIRKILVHAEPGPHDTLVVGTADHLASVYGADLTLVRFVPPGVSLASQAAADYLDQLRQLCTAKSETLLVRGKREETAIGQASAAFDLLVTGGAAQATLWSRLLGSGSVDRLTEAAACSVLRLQTPRIVTHEAFERRRDADAKSAFDLTRYIDPAHAGARLELRRKDALFGHFAQTFAASLDTLRADAILNALWARERTQNTAVGRGVGLPHATMAQADETHLGVFTTDGPVDYQAPDGEGVDVFFVTLGPPRDRQIHLSLLSVISRLALETRMLEGLRSATAADAILAVIRQSQVESS